MAEKLSADKVISEMTEDLTQRVADLKAQGVIPTLALVRLGSNEGDIAYERTAKKRADALGVRIVSFELDDSARTEDVAAVIEKINADPTIHGCLLFRPLPPEVDEAYVSDLLVPEKDIDGISHMSLAEVFVGTTEGTGGFAPATAEACCRMLDFYNIPVEGKRVAVIGRSLVVGRPVAMMLLERNATVTICHSKTVDPAAVTRAADIVVCATGRPRAYGAKYFSEGQTVLDVGINVDESGTLCGDVDFDEVEPIVGAITPVPGGIGSITTSVTLEHVVRAAEAAAKAAAVAVVETVVSAVAAESAGPFDDFDKA